MSWATRAAISLIGSLQHPTKKKGMLAHPPSLLRFLKWSNSYGVVMVVMYLLANVEPKPDWAFVALAMAVTVAKPITGRPK